MIKKLAKRAVKTYLIYKLMKILDMKSPTGHGRINVPYKAMLKRIK